MEDVRVKFKISKVFKVGDKVKVLKYHPTQGGVKIGVVAEEREDQRAKYRLVFKDEGTTSWWHESEIELYKQGGYEEMEKKIRKGIAHLIADIMKKQNKAHKLKQESANLDLEVKEDKKKLESLALAYYTQGADSNDR